MSQQQGDETLVGAKEGEAVLPNAFLQLAHAVNSCSSSLSNKLERISQCLCSISEAEGIKILDRAAVNFLEAFSVGHTDQGEALSLNNTLAIPGVRKTPAISTTPRAPAAPATSIAPETLETLHDFYSSFRVTKIPLPDGSPTPLYGGSPVHEGAGTPLHQGGEAKTKTLSLTAVERLVAVSTKILIQKANDLTEFLSLYNPDQGGSLEALWGPYTPPAGDDNKAIICNLANDLRVNKNAVGRRLMKSILSKRIDIEVKRLDQTNKRLGNGENLRSTARKTIYPLGGDILKVNDIAGQKWNRFKPEVLIGLGNIECNMNIERYMAPEEFDAFIAWMETQPRCKEWKKLSPLAEALKEAYTKRTNTSSINQPETGNASQNFNGTKRSANVKHSKQKRTRLESSSEMNSLQTTSHQNSNQESSVAIRRGPLPSIGKESMPIEHFRNHPDMYQDLQTVPSEFFDLYQNLQTIPSEFFEAPSDMYQDLQPIPPEFFETPSDIYRDLQPIPPAFFVDHPEMHDESQIV